MASAAAIVKAATPDALLLTTSSKRSLESVKLPCHLEPTGLYHSDGERPDGASVIPWKGGKVLVWDETRPDTLAPSHSAITVRKVGAVAAGAEHRNTPTWSPLTFSSL